MEMLLTVVQNILGVGASALLPIMITLLGLYFKMTFFQALKNGLLIGIGFQGLNLVLTLLRTTLGPITKYYSEAGQGFTILDLGWQALAASAWASPFAAIVVPCGLILNIALIQGKLTKTLNVDVWNYWHILMSASIGYYLLTRAGVSGPVAFILGFAFAMLLVIFLLKVADMIAPKWQEYFGLEGTTCTTFRHVTTIWPIVWIGNNILDKIPGLNKADISLSWVNKKLGAFGDTAILGFIVGLFLAVITKQSPSVILQTGVGVSASIILLPRMVGLLMEGLAPVSRSARNYVHKKLGPDQEIYVGMDCALGIGDPSAITTSLILVPLTIGLAFVIPGNEFFPIGLLGSLPYTAAICAMQAKGNLLRAVILGILYTIFTIVVLNFLADLSTAFIALSGTVDLQGQRAVGGSLESIVNVILGIISTVTGVR